MRQGKTAEEVVEGPVFLPDEIKIDQGDVMILGTAVLVKMVTNPPKLKKSREFIWGPYGLRGGSWGNDPPFGRAACLIATQPTSRGSHKPGYRNDSQGFQPVVVLRNVV